MSCIGRRRQTRTSLPARTSGSARGAWIDRSARSPGLREPGLPRAGANRPGFCLEHFQSTPLARRTTWYHFSDTHPIGVRPRRSGEWAGFRPGVGGRACTSTRRPRTTAGRKSNCWPTRARVPQRRRPADAGDTVDPRRAAPDGLAAVEPLREGQAAFPRGLARLLKPFRVPQNDTVGAAHKGLSANQGRLVSRWAVARPRTAPPAAMCRASLQMASHGLGR